MRAGSEQLLLEAQGRLGVRPDARCWDQVAAAWLGAGHARLRPSACASCGSASSKGGALLPPPRPLLAPPRSRGTPRPQRRGS